MSQATSTSTPIPRLGVRSVLVIQREGGVAHFPGLSAPRQIHCAQCTEDQRRRLQALLVQVTRCQAESHGADRRVFRIEVEDDETASPARPAWTVQLDEQHAPEELVALWRHGALDD